MAKKKIYQFEPMTAEPADDDLLLMWDTSEGKTKSLPASLLPSGDGGGGGGGGGIETDLGSPFAVRNTDPNYYPNEETGDSTVTDPRLLGKEDYAVTTTQLGGQEFADDQITYDADAGSFTLLGFQLDDNQKLRVYADGIVTSQANTLLSKIELLLQVAAPFIPTVEGANFGKVWYTGDLAALAGTGWQECVAMRGVFPMHRDPDDPDFNQAIGDKGGAKGVKMKIENLIAHVHKLIKIRTQGNGATVGYVHGAIQGNEETNTESTGSADPEAMKIIPPFISGTWIEFVGLA